MSQIEQLDQNFKTAVVGNRNIVFYPATQAPFHIYGLLPPAQTGNVFLRMPAKTAEKVSEGVAALNCNTAGGRVRFRTDSPFIAIRAKLHSIHFMSHMTLCGSAGFDLYERRSNGERYCGSFIPPYNVKDGYESILEPAPATGDDPKALRDITINFPLYGGVSTLEIGLAQNARIEPPTDYRISQPVVYYGSSVTQGGCASRPGNTYQAILTRRFNCDHVNLGFSGNAKGEAAMADYLAGLSMSCFVCDYDYNSPTAETLQATHEPFFLRVRAQQPDLPIVLVTMPKLPLWADVKKRREIIYQTYQNALNRGDRNVYFVDGSRFFEKLGGDSATVDLVHPNDLGFMSMAEGIDVALQQIFG